MKRVYSGVYTLSRLPDPVQLRNSKQPVRSDVLIRLAEGAGFECKTSKHGTSHMRFRHKEYSDLNFRIVLDTNKLASQRNLSDALIELEKRRTNEILRPSFANATEGAFKKVTGAVPAHIEVEYDFETARIVLRDRHLPQIGLTLNPGEEKIIENKVRYLESIKRDAYILLSRARNMYDIETDISKHGVFSGALSHAVYDLPEKKMERYKAGDSITFVNDLSDYIAEVVERDTLNEIRLSDVLQKSFVKASLVVFHAKRGERTNIISLERPEGGELSLRFETVSNRRAATHDIYSGRITEHELTRVENFMRMFERGHTQASPASRAA